MLYITAFYKMSSGLSVPEEPPWGNATVPCMSHIFWTLAKIIGTSLVWLTTHGPRRVKLFFLQSDPNKRVHWKNLTGFKFSNRPQFAFWCVQQILYKVAFTVECQGIVLLLKTNVWTRILFLLPTCLIKFSYSTRKLFKFKTSIAIKMGWGVFYLLGICVL